MELTKDFFLDKKIVVYQPKKGYRFSIDAPILADYIKIESNESVLLEIGGGCGIISLIISKTKKVKRIYIIEIQEIMAKAIEKNIKENKVDALVKLVKGDFQNYPFKKKFDIIFSNPPYRPVGSGKLPAKESKALAKFEIKLSMKKLLKNSYDLLKEKGSLYLIYPYNRSKDLKRMAEKLGFFRKRERLVYAREGRRPVFFMVEFTKKKGERVYSDSMILENENGKYTDEIEKILRGKDVYN